MDLETLRKTDSLEELFGKWYKEQTECTDEKLLKYAKTSGISLKSFCEDGAVCMDEWRNAKGKRVLYILKEANGSNASKEENGKCVGTYGDPSSFWVKECLGQGSCTSLPKLVEKLVNAQYLLEQKEKGIKGEDLCPFDFGGKDKIHTGQMAFMNLNKMGGASGTYESYLSSYIRVFKNFIIREIELLDPDIIVCGGTYDRLRDNVYTTQEERRILTEHRPLTIRLTHPSYWKNSKITYGMKEIKSDSLVPCFGFPL